jgi:maleate isomerase
MKKLRIGMVVPSLNTVAEDDLRAFCPAEVAYHVHRVRLRKESGRVTMESLMRAHLEAADAAGYLADMGPDAIAFNCTGASVALGTDGDRQLARHMTEALGVPCTNTMVAIKDALTALGAERVLHVCPFTGEFAEIERRSLDESGIDVRDTVSLDFADARAAALMEPEEIADLVRARTDDSVRAVLLSCANIRALGAVAEMERRIGRPVVTSNQAVLWSVLSAAGWRGTIQGGGSLFDRVSAQGGR